MSEELPEPSEETQHAISLAELWRAGKMIGGDEHEACILLLGEVERLRSYARQAVLLERENSPIALVERYGMWLTRLSDGAWGADIPGESGDPTVNPDPKPGEPGHVRATATGKTAAEAILNCAAAIRSGLKAE